MLIVDGLHKQYFVSILILSQMLTVFLVENDLSYVAEANSLLI